MRFWRPLLTINVVRQDFGQEIFAQYFYRECKTDNKNALKNAIFGTKVIHHEKAPKRHRRDSLLGLGWSCKPNDVQRVWRYIKLNAIVLWGE